MSERTRDIILRSRVGEPKEQAFRPRDYPELWKLSFGREGLGGLRRAKLGDVVKMLFPHEMRAGIVLKRENVVDYAIKRYGLNLTVEFDHRYGLEFAAEVDAATTDCPAMLHVSDYEANLPTDGGTQAFYRNLSYQLGHMGIPVLFGEKNDSNIGYYMHRVGQVPVTLLDDQFAAIENRIRLLQGVTDQRAHTFPGFCNLLQLYGYDTEQMLDPQYRQMFSQLQAEFNALSLPDRFTQYPARLMATFGLTVR